MLRRNDSVRKLVQRALVVLVSTCGVSDAAVAAAQPLATSALAQPGAGAPAAERPASDLVARADVAPGGGTYRVLAAKESPSCEACGDFVTYTTFRGEQRTLRRLQGRYVDLLFVDAVRENPWLAPAARLRLVDLADLNFATYRDIVGAEPAGAGRLVIALLAEPDPYGDNASARGYRGSRGIEIYDPLGSGSPRQHDAYAATARVDWTLAHEMAHNFDLDPNATVPTNDPAHLNTRLMQVVTELHHDWRLVALTPPGRFDSSVRTEREKLERAGSYRMRMLAEGPRPGTYADCFLRDQCPSFLVANEASAAITLRAAEFSDAQFFRRYFRARSAVSAAAGSVAVGTAGVDRVLEAVSIAAAADYTCLAGPFGWAREAAVGARMAARALPRAAACDDRDGDGAVGFLDFDDADARAFWGADETVDGVDNDGDGAIDEVAVAEADFRAAPAALYPVAIDGRVEAGTVDSYALPALPSRRARVELCTADPAGVGAGLAIGDTWAADGTVTVTTRAGRAACVYQELSIPAGDAAPTLRVSSMGTSPSYRVTVSALPAHRNVIASFLLDRALVDGVDVVRYAATAGVAPMPAAARVRLWIAGEGYVAEQAASASGTFAVPAAYVGQPIAARVQAHVDTVPVMPTGDRFELPAPVPTVPFDGVASGLYADPARNGEGWQLSRLAGANAPVLVSLYTQRRDAFDPDDARALWFVGVSEPPLAGQDHLDLALATTAGGEGRFARPVAAYEAAQARLTRLADGRIRASMIGANGESIPATLAPMSTADDGASAYAGVWYAAEAPGEGFAINAGNYGGEVRAAVVWYSYCRAFRAASAACGDEPHWIVGGATLTGSGLAATLRATMYDSVGARFGVLFDPADAATARVGEITLTTPRCGALRIAWTGDDGRTLTRELVRTATSADALDCRQ